MLYRRGKMDFPWAYNNRSPHSDTKFGAGANGDYRTIPDPEAMAVWAPWISSLFHPKEAILFAWIVEPKQKFCIRFLEACGFEVVTTGPTWVKTLKYDDTKFRTNPGFYFASNLERMLVCVRGSVPPIQRLVNQVYEESYVQLESWDDYQGEAIKHPLLYGAEGKPIHSRKPDIFRERIDQAYPSAVYGIGIGLFEREPQGPGWHVFGDQIKDSEGNLIPSDVEGPVYEPTQKRYISIPNTQLRLFG